MQEWETVRGHSAIGANLLNDIADPLAERAASLSMWHHENFDGTGYPDGLKGDAIPIDSRIVALCDVYDALREVRPYKPALPHERAVDIILKGDERTQPSKFDPNVLSAFEKVAQRFAAIYGGQSE